METLRVLVTDDELGMRLGVARTLRDFTVHVPDVNEDVAFDVDQAESARRPWRRSASQPPDILLLDHKMPGISGLDVLGPPGGHAGRHADDHDHGLRLDRDGRHAPPSAGPTIFWPSRSRPTN